MTQQILKEASVDPIRDNKHWENYQAIRDNKHWEKGDRETECDQQTATTTVCVCSNYITISILLMDGVHEMWTAMWSAFARGQARPEKCRYKLINHQMLQSPPRKTSTGLHCLQHCANHHQRTSQSGPSTWFWVALCHGQFLNVAANPGLSVTISRPCIGPIFMQNAISAGDACVPNPPCLNLQPKNQHDEQPCG